jgi:hypothetical protein
MVPSDEDCPVAYTISSKEQLDLFKFLIRLQVIPPFNQFLKAGKLNTRSGPLKPIKIYWRVTFQDDKIGTDGIY